MKQIIVLSIVALVTNFTTGADKTAKEYFQKAEKQQFDKDLKGAYKNYSKAIQLDTNYFEAYFRRAVLKTKMDSFVSAIKDYDRCLKINKTGETYYRRANIKWTLKDSVGACVDWTNACDLIHNKSCDLKRGHCR